MMSATILDFLIPFPLASIIDSLFFLDFPRSQFLATAAGWSSSRKNTCYVAIPTLL